MTNRPDITHEMAEETIRRWMELKTAEEDLDVLTGAAVTQTNEALGLADDVVGALTTAFVVYVESEGIGSIPVPRELTAGLGYLAGLQQGVLLERLRTAS